MYLTPRKTGFLLPVLCWTILLFAFRLDARAQTGREKISLNEGWRFTKGDPGDAGHLSYDVRPGITDKNDSIVADAKPTEGVQMVQSDTVLKRWILPTANHFIKDPAKHYQRPAGNPGATVSYVQVGYNDRDWEQVNLPHDWAIRGPFYAGENPVVGGGMGRLPSQGVGWYRRKIDVPLADKGRKISLEVEGAMSYALVWLNGNLVGGWPYGYNSFVLDLTPYVKPGGENQLVVRLDNPPSSSRWYPGGGIYRNVWLLKTQAVHVAQWGTKVSTRNVSAASAVIDLAVEVENGSATRQFVQVATDLYTVNRKTGTPGQKVGTFPAGALTIAAGEKALLEKTFTLRNPLLWGPLTTQQPNLYMAVSRLLVDGSEVDRFGTPFGIRALQFSPDKGLLVNGQAVKIQGVNQHHDLGALGAAFNRRAAERQLQLLQELGCNAIRLSHNPPAPELLDLTDRMGFLVIDEIFDNWERKKTPLDFHLIFPDWHEADTRAFIRRDRNHPSVIAWSFGNEVGEQYTAEEGAAIARTLCNIVHEEDSTRPATASMNYAKPGMPFPTVMDILSLNYQGEGIRDAPAYAHLKGIRTSPLYPAFRKQFPGKLILSSETASALSTRGTYVFPVTPETSAPVSDSTGGDPLRQAVSAYELYTAQFGASPDKVFSSQDKHPYVAGEFVWSGWDYLGEPTPYYSARSSYSGIIDLAGFKKDRFYLYQSRWRPNLPMVHILPHWNWPGRTGQVTPVHVFTSGDEAELFLNGRSLGKKKKGAYEYRLRWDDVVYAPGKLKVVAYKKGQKWAEEEISTTGAADRLLISVDRRLISADGSDLSFVTVRIADAGGITVPTAADLVSFKIEGPGSIEATDNGDPADLQSFASPERNAFSGLVLAIIRSERGKTGTLKVTASAPGLKPASVSIQTK